MGNIVLPIDAKEVSDGYHTFQELYDHRHYLMCALMASNPKKSWKSKLHDDGTMFDDMFIVGMELPNGMITYHLPDYMWEVLDGIEEKPHAPAWDGHTSEDVIRRLGNFCINALKESQK